MLHVSAIDPLFRQKSWWLANLGVGLGYDWHPLLPHSKLGALASRRPMPLSSQSRRHIKPRGRSLGMGFLGTREQYPKPLDAPHLTVNLKRVEALPPFLTSSCHDAELIPLFLNSIADQPDCRTADF